MPNPTFTREQVRRVDRLAVEQYGMNGLVLMENAGRGCADILCRHSISGTVAIFCGKGNNAGDGFVIARHLDLRGHQVIVLLCFPPSELQGDAAENYKILTHCEIPIVEIHSNNNTDERILTNLTDADWIVDAMLGTGSRGEPRPPLKNIIEILNSHTCRKLAVDIPSGLDCDTGIPAATTFLADLTCTFVAYKPGLLAAEAAQSVGEIHVLDIGVPKKLIREVILK